MQTELPVWMGRWFGCSTGKPAAVCKDAHLIKDDGTSATRHRRPFGRAVDDGARRPHFLFAGEQDDGHSKGEDLQEDLDDSPQEEGSQACAESRECCGFVGCWVWRTLCLWGDTHFHALQPSGVRLFSLITHDPSGACSDGVVLFLGTRIRMRPRCLKRSNGTLAMGVGECRTRVSVGNRCRGS